MSVRIHGSIALAFVAALGASGCSGIVDLQAGPARSVSHHPEHSGVAVNLAAGIGPGEDSGGGGLGCSLRTRTGFSSSQVAIAPHFYLLAGGSKAPLVGYFRGGFALIDLEHLDRRDTFGMFGPFAEIGTLVHLMDTVGITASIGHEYDVRFDSGVANEGYWTFLLGIGAAGSSGSL